MRRTLSRDQRIVVVVAWGLGLACAATVVAWHLGSLGRDGGWFNYAPNDAALIPRPAFLDDPTPAVVVWAGAIGLWLIGALWLLRSRRSESEHPIEGGA